MWSVELMNIWSTGYSCVWVPAGVACENGAVSSACEEVKCISAEILLKVCVNVCYVRCKRICVQMKDTSVVYSIKPEMLSVSWARSPLEEEVMSWCCFTCAPLSMFLLNMSVYSPSCSRPFLNISQNNILIIHMISVLVSWVTNNFKCLLIAIIILISLYNFAN